MPTLWQSQKRKTHHIIRRNHDSNNFKFITTLSELGQVFWNSLAFLHFDFLQFVLQCQFPLVTFVLIQCFQRFPHNIWSFLAMETRDNVVSNSLKDYLSRLRHTLLSFDQIMCIWYCCLRNVLINEFLQAIILEHSLHSVPPGYIIWVSFQGILESQTMECHLSILKYVLQIQISLVT